MIDEYRQLAIVVRAQEEVSPRHALAIARRLDGQSAEQLTFLESLAGQILRIVGSDLNEFCRDYDWLADIILEEELFFRRNNRYRISSFDEAYRDVYSNQEYMKKYMNGLLLTQLWWDNHTHAIDAYYRRFLPGNKDRYRHLEIGPGHGLLIWAAANDPRCDSCAGWDVSDASLSSTKDALAAMGVGRQVELVKKNLFDHPAGEFDSIVFAEILEHLEDPLAALKILKSLLSSDGRLFVHAPVNSPAPDHISLFRSSDDILDLVRQAGLQLIDWYGYPAKGYSLERAQRLQTAVSVVAIVKR